MRYKAYIGATIVRLLAACSFSLPMTFAEQQGFYHWHLPIQVFHNPHDWDDHFN